MLRTPRLLIRISSLQYRKTGYGFQRLNKINAKFSVLHGKMMFLVTFRVGSKSLYGQRAASIFQHVNIIVLVMRLQLLQLSYSTLRCMSDSGQISMAQSPTHTKRVSVLFETFS